MVFIKNNECVEGGRVRKRGEGGGGPDAGLEIMKVVSHPEWVQRVMLTPCLAQEHSGNWP